MDKTNNNTPPENSGKNDTDVQSGIAGSQGQAIPGGTEGVGANDESTVKARAEQPDQTDQSSYVNHPEQLGQSGYTGQYNQSAQPGARTYNQGAYGSAYNSSSASPGSAGAGTRQYVPPKKGSGWKKGIIIFAAIIIVVAVLGVTFNGIGPSDSAYTIPQNGEYIAIMKVEGTISATDDSAIGSTETYNHQWTLDTIDEIMDDVNNVGLVMFVNTPGGGVYESDELYLKLMEYQDTTERPYYVAMGTTAASGGYYISANADKIFANRNTWTGSIGVTMGTVIDISEFLENNGISTTTLTAGRNKAMGSYFDPITDEQRAIFQGLVDDAYNQFTGIIADGRGMDIEEVRTLADGRVYTANQALNNGLIDEVGTLNDALNDMEAEYGLDVNWAEIFYVKEPSWIDSIIAELGQFKADSQGDVAAVLEAAEKYNNMPISYLYER